MTHMDPNTKPTISMAIILERKGKQRAFMEWWVDKRVTWSRNSSSDIVHSFQLKKPCDKVRWLYTKNAEFNVRRAII